MTLVIGCYWISIHVHCNLLQTSDSNMSTANAMQRSSHSGSTPITEQTSLIIVGEGTCDEISYSTVPDHSSAVGNRLVTLKRHFPF